MTRLTIPRDILARWDSANAIDLRHPDRASTLSFNPIHAIIFGIAISVNPMFGQEWTTRVDFGETYGAAYTLVRIERTSKLIVAWHLGKRNTYRAEESPR